MSQRPDVDVPGPDARVDPAVTFGSAGALTLNVLLHSVAAAFVDATTRAAVVGHLSPADGPARVRPPADADGDVVELANHLGSRAALACAEVVHTRVVELLREVAVSGGGPMPAPDGIVAVAWDAVRDAAICGTVGASAARRAAGEPIPPCALGPADGDDLRVRRLVAHDGPVPFPVVSRTVDQTVRRLAWVLAAARDPQQADDDLVAVLAAEPGARADVRVTRLQRRVDLLLWTGGWDEAQVVDAAARRVLERGAHRRGHPGAT